MELVQLLGSTLGLGFVSGINLYATVLVLGLGIRFHIFQVAFAREHLQVLADPLVLTVAGIAFLIEFIADKIPWVDSIWDSFHTFIRPVGAIVLAVMALGHTDPALKLALVILCGGVALTSHGSKAGIRLAANHSPEPFSNIALSLAEDLLVVGGTWVAVQHPMLALGVVAVFLAGVIWLAPKVFRLIARSVRNIWSFFTGEGRPAEGRSR